MVLKVKEYFEKTRQVINTYNCVSHIYHDCIKTLIIVKISSININIFVSIYILKITTILESIFYEDKET